MGVDQGSELCTKCGMCCDGTLFGAAALEPEERARVKLPLIGTNLRLPCAHLSAASCTIYETRFAVCHDYRCALLRALEEGTVDLATAQSKVERVLALRSDLERALPPGNGVAWERVAREGQRPRDAAAGEWMLAAAALRLALSRDFADPALPNDEPR